ncbi:MAG: amidohydrolase [Candidatus Micrarchaeota archaeon]
MYEVFGGYAILPSGIGRDISLAIDKGIIADVGPRGEIRRRHKFSDSIGSKDSIISPGFIDTHMHSSQIATRGLTSDKSLLDWLKRYIWRWEGGMGREQARSCADLAYLEMLRSGVTTFVDYTSVRHTDEAFKAAEKLGLRGNIGKTLMDRASPKELEEGAHKALKDSESLIRKWHGKAGGRLRCNITPRFGITCTDRLLSEAFLLSEKYQTLFTTHANESRFEVQEDRKNYGCSSIEHFRKLGILGPRTLLAHCIWLGRKEMGILSKTGTNVAHCPGSNMMLSSGCAKIKEMLKMGIKVGLGSDMGAYYNLSMFEQMRLSVMLQKVSRLDPVALDHKAAFMMATRGGADALSLPCGALEKGKMADITLLSARHIGFSPRNDILAQAVYCGTGEAVEAVICDGKVLMRDGRLLVADGQRIIDRASEILRFGK